MNKLIERLIAFSLKNHVFILFLTALLFLTGVVCYKNTPIEAYPDVTNTRVRVITQWAGRSAEEIEKFITLPIMKEMNTIPKKTDVRSTSLFGLSVVTVLFEDGVEDFYAQQYAANRLQGVDLPEGAEYEIEPPSGATGEIYRYVLESDLPISEVTAINEWVVERELLAVPGVASITSFGGEEKIYEVKVNPQKLAGYGLSPLDVYEAIASNNINVGGDIIEVGTQAFVVRGIGLLESIEDIENILITIKGSNPIRIGQVASVELSAKPRLGQVGLDNDSDVVQGIVVMLRGENPTQVIDRLKVKIDELNNGILPETVKIHPFLDRTTLVNTTVTTVLTNLLEGVLLVSIVVFIFLFDWRTTFIVATVIPLSFLFAITLLRIQGLPANLISMGALDFGLLLEGTLVIVEVVFVALANRTKELGDKFEGSLKGSVVKKSASSVAPHIFFAQIILVVALIPIFSFEKVEGKMFSPLAYTLGYALMGSLLLSLTYVPVMCKLLLSKPVVEKSNRFSRFLIDRLHRLYLLASKKRKLTISLFLILLIALLGRFHFWGTEFIPNMDEGAVYIRATLPNSVTLKESVKLTQEMREQIGTYEEVDFVLSQTGRPNDGTDSTGFFNIEFHVQLKPQKQWSRKISKNDFIEELEELLESYPGVTFGFSQPIQDNVEEYVAGVKSALVIKIFGKDLNTLEEYASDVASTIEKVEGIEDVNVFNSIGLPELQIELQEKKMATYGVAVADAQAVIEMAIGGKVANHYYEGERIFDITLRYEEAYRDNVHKIKNIQVPTLHGNSIPLNEIAEISFKTGPTFIYREGSQRYIGIGFSIRGRDLGSTIAEAQKEVAKLSSIPKSTKIEWAGEFESQQRATKRLTLIVPAVLILILVLLYMHFNSVKDTLLAASAMPYAFIGGFLSLWVTQTNFGISAGIGFIILFGIVSIDSILLISLMKNEFHSCRNIDVAIDRAVSQRIRPVLMIALMGSMGLLPAAISTGMGSEIQKPLAIMIVGGIIICMILSFTVLPQVFYYAYRNEK